MSKIKALTSDQISTLSIYYERRCADLPRGLRDYTFMSLCLHCGLRVGECTQLTWPMVWFNGKPMDFINISPSISKFKVERQVPIPKIVSDSLVQYRKFDYVPASNPNDYLFPSLRNPHKHMTTRSFQKILRRHSLFALGISISPHTLRHTYATRLMRLTDLPTVKLLLGHKSIKSTQIYTHPSSDDLRNAVKKLDELNRGL